MVLMLKYEVLEGCSNENRRKFVLWEKVVDLVVKFKVWSEESVSILKFVG